MMAKILHDLHSALSCQIFLFIWNVYTRMHVKFGELFLEFLTLK